MQQLRVHGGRGPHPRPATPLLKNHVPIGTVLSAVALARDPAARPDAAIRSSSTFQVHAVTGPVPTAFQLVGLLRGRRPVAQRAARLDPHLCLYSQMLHQ